MDRLINKLRPWAENVLVAMMAVMFCAFIAQVLFRYVLNMPLAWTEEISTLIWLWGILWAASFVMRNNEDIRFDMLYNLLPHAARRWLTVLASSAIVLILGASLPAAHSYVSFMKVEKSAAMGLPMHWVFSIYLVFVVAMCVRHALIAWQAFNNRLVQDAVSAALESANQVPTAAMPVPAAGPAGTQNRAQS